MGVNAITTDGVGMGLTATRGVCREGVVVATSRASGVGKLARPPIRACMTKATTTNVEARQGVGVVPAPASRTAMGVTGDLTNSKGSATRSPTMGVGPSSIGRSGVSTTSLTDSVGATSTDNEEVPKVGRGDHPRAVRPGDFHTVTEGPPQGDRSNRPRPHDDAPHREGAVQGGLIGSYSTRQVGEGGLDGALNEPDVVISLGHRISRNWIGGY